MPVVEPQTPPPFPPPGLTFLPPCASQAFPFRPHPDLSGGGGPAERTPSFVATFVRSLTVHHCCQLLATQDEFWTLLCDFFYAF